MPAPAELSPAALAVALLQLALLLISAVLLWRDWLRPAARQATAALVPWPITPSDFALAALLVFGGGYSAQLLSSLFGAPTGDVAVVIQGSAFQLGMLTAALVVRLKFPGPAHVGAHPSGAFAGGAATFAAALGPVTLVTWLWQNGLLSLGVEMERQTLIDIFARNDSVVALAVMSLFTVVIAPLTEELVFRAGLFRFLRPLAGRWPAVAVSSVLFAALHVNLAAFLPLCVLGAGFALAYERTGRIIVPVIAHALFNLNTLLLVFAGLGQG